MRLRLPLVACLGLVLVAPAGAAAIPGPYRAAPDLATGVSSPNWSGYAVSRGGPYTSVSASWVAPALECSETPDAAASFWVGLDGYADATVEQTGTEATCTNGRATYGGWFEVFPKPGVNFGRRAHPVLPGDVITASVTALGSGRFVLALSDPTEGWRRTVTRTRRGARLSSAEVIAESPSGSGGIFPLADFGTVAFSAAEVDGQTLSGSSAGLQSITLERHKQVEAVPSALLEGSFGVSWQAQGLAAIAALPLGIDAGAPGAD